MADNSGIIKIALIGGVAYYAYSQGWLSVLGLGGAVAPASTGGVPAGGGSTVTPPVSPTPHVLDAIYSRMVGFATADGVTVAGPDAWDVYAVRAGAPNPMPAPEDAGLKRSTATAITPPSQPVPTGNATVDALNQQEYIVQVQAWMQAQYQANQAGGGTYTAAQYWAAMAPLLKSKYGLAGLGIYGGLGALVRRYA